MKRNAAIWTLLIMAIGNAAYAGGIHGKVSGAKGTSVVSIEAIPGKTFTPPEKHFLMDQRRMQFVPHVLAMQLDGTVDFMNSDKVDHNVFWPSIRGNKKKSHNMGTIRPGEKKPYAYHDSGDVPLLCNVHPEMSGYIYVSPTPYYAETDSDGNYKIENVPDGSYTITAWNENAKPQSKPVAVKGDTEVNFTLSKK